MSNKIPWIYQVEEMDELEPSMRMTVDYELNVDFSDSFDGEWNVHDSQNSNFPKITLNQSVFVGIHYDIDALRFLF